MINEQSKGNDFKKPGHISPLISKKGGVIERPGHTEAAVDLARLAGSTPAGVICEIIKDDGTMARVSDLRKIADEHQLKMITIKDLIQYRMANETLIKREVEISLPSEYGNFHVIGYSNKRNNDEHIAIVKGNITSRSEPFVRIHEQNVVGDVFGSLYSISNSNLQSVFKEMENHKSTVLLYLRKEERECGLIKKMKAYKLQQQTNGKDKVDDLLQVQIDVEDHLIAVQILRELGITQMKSFHNESLKMNILNEYDLDIYGVNFQQSHHPIKNTPH